MSFFVWLSGERDILMTANDSFCSLLYYAKTVKAAYEILRHRLFFQLLAYSNNKQKFQEILKNKSVLWYLIYFVISNTRHQFISKEIYVDCE